MVSRDEEFIVVPNPNDPNRPIRAKLLRYHQTRGQENEYNEYTLEDGTRIRLFIDVESIYRPFDPVTGNLAVNPKTGEPQININWGVRIMTVYSEKALREIEREANK
jgi:hypothetical protein